MNANGELVFVYGTLRRGASNAFRMEGAEFVSSGLVKGRIYVIDWFPGFVSRGGDGWVEGELWRVDGASLKSLDDFEGDDYERVSADVRPMSGRWMMVLASGFLGTASGRESGWKLGYGNGRVKWIQRSGLKGEIGWMLRIRDRQGFVPSWVACCFRLCRLEQL